MSKSQQQDSNHARLQVRAGSGSDSVTVYVGDHLQKPSDYRKLAVASIICGLSCIGILSLIYSVKTSETNKRSIDGEEKAKMYSAKARKFGILAILAWVVLIVLFPFLLGLLSFLLTFID